MLFAAVVDEIEAEHQAMSPQERLGKLRREFDLTQDQALEILAE
jgi:hypothetical protein